MISPLLRAILDAPDDDDVRLVYADWLIEKGEAARAELIQLQCRAPTPETQRREEALLRKHGKEWLAPIRAYIQSWTWSRGFVEHVTANGKKFIPGIDAIFETTPLRGLALVGRKRGDLETIAQSRHSHAFRSLTLAMSKLDVEPLRQLVKFTKLEELDLTSNPIGKEGCYVLAESPAPIRRLRMHDCALALDAVALLARAAFFPGLTHLWLSNNRALGPETGAAFGRAESLVELDLGSAALGDDGVERLAATPALTNLERLQLFGNGVTMRGVRALVESPHLPKLRILHGLPFTRDTAEGQLLYARSPYWIAY